MTETESVEKQLLKRQIEMLSALTLYLVGDNPIISNHPLWSRKELEIRALFTDLQQHI